MPIQPYHLQMQMPVHEPSQNDGSTATFDLPSLRGLKLNAVAEEHRNRPSLLKSSKPIDSNRFHTLKKRILTRWNTILTMLRSYSLNINGIENYPASTEPLRIVAIRR